MMETAVSITVLQLTRLLNGLTPALRRLRPRFSSLGVTSEAVECNEDHESDNSCFGKRPSTVVIATPCASEDPS